MKGVRSLSNFAFSKNIMGNSYFKFKQFIIEQDKTAMKVCTDSCLFGSVLAVHYPAKQVLDIGTGTGLLSLMYVQKNIEANIDAIEIEANAFQQAKENIAQSIWYQQIILEHNSLQKFQPSHTYDLILSNPPFFENDLHSATQNRNTAMHSTELTLSEIFAFATEYLIENGLLALLIPFHRTEETEKMGTQYALYIIEKILVRQSPRHPFFRSILIFGKQPLERIKTTEITIRNENNDYTDDFSGYMKDYYLFL